MSSDRYDRQRRLAEIGAPGQERIRASHARIAAGPGASIELAYLVRAGVENVQIARALPRPFAHTAHFRFGGPLALASGAHAALLHLLAAARRA